MIAVAQSRVFSPQRCTNTAHFTVYSANLPFLFVQAHCCWSQRLGSKAKHLVRHCGPTGDGDRVHWLHDLRYTKRDEKVIFSTCAPRSKQISCRRLWQLPGWRSSVQTRSSGEVLVQEARKLH